MDRTNLLYLAIEAWGEEKQELMAIEEMSELHAETGTGGIAHGENILRSMR